MDTKNFTIGVLSTTAVVLLVGLFLMHAPQQPAFAGGMTILKDDFNLVVGAANKNDEDLVYVIDGPGEKMVSYRYDAGRKEIILVQGISLKEMRAAGQGGAAPGSKNPPSNPRKKP